MLRKMTMCFLAICLSISMMAQAPKKFNYQGIARDTLGKPMVNQKLALKLTVLPTQDATQAEYEETQHVTTNEFGLYTLQIGNGTSVTGDMKTVKWETGNKYIHVTIDPQGGTNYLDAGTTQLLSVPYALYADQAGVTRESLNENSQNTTRATNNYIEKTNGAGVANSTSLLYDNGINIGLGTANPSAKFHINSNAGNSELFRLQNNDPAGYGRFTLYGNSSSSYATFTKYGSNYPGGYAGISALYPYLNLLALGNNEGPLLFSNSGNVGISIYKGGTSKLKFHVDYATENVGIGGNSTPVSRVHLNNTHGTTMDLNLTNNTTGHLVTDGLQIKNVSNAASIINKENEVLMLGTNNATRVTITAAGNTELTGQIKIAGGAPGLGKVLTSDATGLATWQTPVAGPQGIQGPIGLTGATGPQGPIGLTGPQGPQGPAGADGTNGTNGNDGATGPQGPTGPIGPQGSAGFVNINGTTNYIPKFTGTTTAGNSQIFDDGTNIGIGTTTPTAKLDVNGTIKIAGGSPGLGKVLTSDANGLANWQNTDSSNNTKYWKTTGNSGLGVPSFIGTTDTQALRFKINNQPFGTFYNNANLSLGKKALSNYQSGVGVIAIGEEALRYGIAPSAIVAIGPYAFRDLLYGTNNIGLGTVAPQADSVTSSILIGNSVGYKQENIKQSILIGNNAGITNQFFSYPRNKELLNNVAIGYYAFTEIGDTIPVIQKNNVAIASYALSNSNGSDNIGIGLSAGQNLKNSFNIAVGSQTLNGGCLGYANIAFGPFAYNKGVNIQSSISIGYNSNAFTLNGTGNTTVGVAAAGLKISGDRNNYMGWHTGIKNITGDDNVFLGVHIGGLNTNDASRSTLVGAYSGYSMSNGATENTSLGFETGYDISSGSKNLLLGYQAGKFMTSQSNVIAIGYQAGANNTQSNRVIIGYNELPRFPDAASAAAALPAAGPDGVYVYWNTTTNQIMVRP